ncbi:MAG TPA: universal stress protein [Geminicoccaceae bacterium]|nr:universal stress protein [Geminicoccaceae bacterium]
MAYRTILVDLAGDDGLESRLQVARRIADRSNAVLVGMHVMPPPFIPASYGEAAAYLESELLEAQRKANRETADRILATFREICGEGSHATWQEAEGDRGQLLAEAAHATDLVLARQTTAGSADARAVLDELVTATGVPVLALPRNISGELGRTALVAWNGSREAARAAHDALPFLRAAKQVILCGIGERAQASLDAADAMLRRHGVDVQAHKIDEPDGNAGQVLLEQAEAHAADLLVMGAYGHSRLREMVFGGATNHVLREATLPVLFGN